VNDLAVLRVSDSVAVPRAELSFRASRSGGPGGQHVNTSSTRVELIWSVASTPSLSEEQRTRVMEKLANRINAEGELLLAESGSRSQLQNREAVIERFVEILAGALHVPPRRKKTRPPKAERERRLQAKKRRSEVKRLRGRVSSD
jgi:ribosome-associated protein